MSDLEKIISNGFVISIRKNPDITWHEPVIIECVKKNEHGNDNFIRTFLLKSGDFEKFVSDAFHVAKSKGWIDV